MGLGLRSNLGALGGSLRAYAEVEEEGTAINERAEDKRGRPLKAKERSRDKSGEKHGGGAGKVFDQVVSVP